MKFTELSEQEFAESDFSCRNFLQDVAMYRRYYNEGREAYLVGVKDGKKVLAAGLMLMRNWHFGLKVGRIPGGGTN